MEDSEGQYKENQSRKSKKRKKQEKSKKRDRLSELKIVDLFFHFSSLI